MLDRLAAEEAELLPPPLLMEEVSNALLTGIRRGRWSGAAADAGRALLVGSWSQTTSSAESALPFRTLVWPCRSYLMRLLVGLEVRG